MPRSKALRLSDVRAIFRLLSDMRELRGDRAAWQRQMISGLCSLTGARQGSSLLFVDFAPDKTARLVDSVYGGWTSPQTAVMWDQLMKSDDWRGDPILNEAVKVAGTLRTRMRHTLIGDREWYRSSVWDAVSRPTGMDDVLVCWYRRHDGQHVRGLSLQRAKEDGTFSIRDRNILHLFNVELYRLYLDGKLDGPPPAGASLVTPPATSGKPDGPAAGPALAGPKLPPFAPRVRQVLRLLLQGDSVKQVAAKMGITRRTVEDYVKTLHRQFGVNSRAELLAKFVPAYLNEMPRESPINGE